MFKNPPQAREHGIYFNGASYSCIRADKNSIYAKKVCDFFGDDPDYMFGYNFPGTDKNYNGLGHVLFPHSYQMFHFYFVNVNGVIVGNFRHSSFISISINNVAYHGVHALVGKQLPK